MQQLDVIEKFGVFQNFPQPILKHFIRKKMNLTCVKITFKYLHQKIHYRGMLNSVFNERFQKKQNYLVNHKAIWYYYHEKIKNEKGKVYHPPLRQ